MFKLIGICRIIKSESKLTIIEIDTENNRELIDDLNKKKIMKKINQSRAEKKNWSRLRFGESICNI